MSRQTMKALFRNIAGERLYTSLYHFIAHIHPFWKSYRESRKAKERKLFYAAFIKAGALCFDIGANNGNRVEAFLAAGAKVVAVEPQKSCCELLRKKFGGKITIINKGVGSRPGTMKFYPSNISALSSFSTDWIASVQNQRFENATWEAGDPIEMTTVDELIREFGKPAYVKIDVEGYESEVLAGLSEPVPMISFEFTVPERTDNAVECIHKIVSLSGEVECNYTVREQMQFVLKEWIRAGEMVEMVRSKDFVDTSAGDIYVRAKGNLF